MKHLALFALAMTVASVSVSATNVTTAGTLPSLHSDGDNFNMFLSFLDKEFWHDQQGYGISLKNWMWFVPVVAYFVYLLFWAKSR